MSKSDARGENDVRILIVEDDIAIALDIEATLLADGHEVVGIARNEREALELAHEADLAFVDVRLADGLSGPRIAQKLNKGFGVAVVYLTGNPKLIDENDEPVFELVSKPHTSESIVEALRATAAASIQTATAASRRNELEAPGNDVKTPPDV